MYTIEGDLLDVEKGTILQQVNCMGVMGSGLALAIKNKYPKVFECYKKSCDNYQTTCKHHPNERMLGCIQRVNVIPAKLDVVNVFGQCGYGGDKVHTDYQALDCAFGTLRKMIDDEGLRLPIYAPYLFGCGLANGDPEIVHGLFDKHFKLEPYKSQSTWFDREVIFVKLPRS